MQAPILSLTTWTPHLSHVYSVSRCQTIPLIYLLISYLVIPPEPLSLVTRIVVWACLGVPTSSGSSPTFLPYPLYFLSAPRCHFGGVIFRVELTVMSVQFWIITSSTPAPISFMALTVLRSVEYTVSLAPSHSTLSMP